MTEAMAPEQEQKKKERRDLPDDFEFGMGTVGKSLAPYFEEKFRKKRAEEQEGDE